MLVGDSSLSHPFDPEAQGCGGADCVSPNHEPVQGHLLQVVLHMGGLVIIHLHHPLIQVRSQVRILPGCHQGFLTECSDTHLAVKNIGRGTGGMETVIQHQEDLVRTV